ncbi:hypothetical protein ZL58_14535 [Salmonella enterica subsp. enterica serovar Typhimurium]|nr:hypothetical protein [Salmonella enterica subsp. enterica serovar Typhimurium]
MGNKTESASPFDGLINRLLDKGYDLSITVDPASIFVRLDYTDTKGKSDYMNIPTRNKSELVERINKLVKARGFKLIKEVEGK